jgi:hypothetical protein
MIVPTTSFAAVAGPARVKMMDGDVLFRTPDSDEWLPALINTPLDEGDAIWCAENSKAEIQLPDGSIIRIDERSHLDILANEDGFIHLHLATGRAYVRTAKTIAGNSLQIDADDTTVLPAARTRLRIDILPYNQEDVSIFKGSAYVEGNGSRTKVRTGEHIALEDGHSAFLSLNPPDRWEYWNMERDREQSRSTRTDSYLPDELRGYSDEMDSNGRWVRVPEYGMVWRPTVILSNDWAPYRSGRWIWKGSDYVWISYESWGWVPYHFGRWAVVSGLGWCWVPPARGDVYWGPGYVGWYRTGSHVGWTPLAPGETFYGRRHYGRNSVNITTTNVHTGNIVYRNRQVRGGMTVLPHNDFLRGRVVSQPASGSSSVSVSVSIGSPRIQPVRETRMPIVKQTPPRVAPPVIERRDNREMRQRFPRVTPQTETHRGQQQRTTTVPSSQPPHTRSMQTSPPVALPAEKPVNPPVPPDRTQQRREERRQHSPALQPVAPQAAPPQPVPPAPAAVPKQNGQPQRTPASMPTGQPSPATAQPRGERTPPPASQSSIATPAGSTPQRAEKPRNEPNPKELRQRKIWRVNAQEEVREQDQKEKGNKGREHRER